MLKFKTLLAFAKDSVSCIAYFYKDTWSAPPCKVKSPFANIMGEAIIQFTLYHREWLHCVAEEVAARVDKDREEFFEFGYELADKLFQNEPFMELIAICSCITYIAHILFIMGNRQCMDRAYFMIAILFLKLKNRFEENGGWKDFRFLCLEYATRNIQEGKVKQQNLNEEVPNTFEVYCKSLTDIQKNSTQISKQSTITRSKSSADSIQLLTVAIKKSSSITEKSTGVLSKFITVFPKSTSVIPKWTGASPKSTGKIPKSTRAVSKLTVVSLISTATLTGSKTFTKSTEAIPKSTEAIPKSTKVIPKSTKVIPKSTKVIPKSTEALSKSNNPKPKSTGVYRKSTGPIPKSAGADLKSTEALSKSINPKPKSTGVSRKSTVPIPISTDATSESSGEVPKPRISNNCKSDARLKKTGTFPTADSNLVSVTAHLINVGAEDSSKFK